MMRLLLGFLLIMVMGSTAYGQQAQRFGGANLNFRGMSGYMGFGVAEFTVMHPSQEFRMDSGQQFYVAGEKQIGKSGLFITVSMSFMQNKGQSFYDYTTLGGTQYTNQPGTEIEFNAEHFHLGMGGKFKIFPTSFFRPYGEAGGLFSYHGLNYRFQDGQLNNANGGQKGSDSLIGFGYYFEAGIEVDFSEQWGVRVSGRYLVSDTRPFETLGNENVKYEARIFQFGVGRRF